MGVGRTQASQKDDSLLSTPALSRRQVAAACVSLALGLGMTATSSPGTKFIPHHFSTLTVSFSQLTST